MLYFTIIQLRRKYFKGQNVPYTLFRIPSLMAEDRDQIRTCLLLLLIVKNLVRSVMALVTGVDILPTLLEGS
jgi:hypothetical protein